jgi:two-component system sensor histidine kinase BaeS
MTQPPYAHPPMPHPYGPPAVPSVPGPGLDALFGEVWTDAEVPGRPRLLLVALGVGVLAALLLPGHDTGLGTLLVLAAMGGAALLARRDRSLFGVISAVAYLLLIATTFVRDAEWIVMLCLLAAAGLLAVTLAGGRSFVGVIGSGLAIPLAALRGLPWLGRSLRAAHGPSSALSVLRTAALSVVLVVVFVALFASADAVFATWTDALLPDLRPIDLIGRPFVLVACGGATLAGLYVAINPPALENVTVKPGKAVTHRWEWLVPVGLVVLVYALFVLAQATAMFGGHAYLRRTTGLTYAEYVHQGFGQLVVVTVLTLAVVAVAVRKAAAFDRTFLRLALGALAALTLVVVVSALYRLHVYEQAYGFTRLRLLVSFFEGWLGLLVLMVLAAGVVWKAGWLPRAAVLSAAMALLVLAGLNPDAWIAHHNLDRYQETHKIDLAYLSGLSADAAPVIGGQLPGLRTRCGPEPGSWLDWNIGRLRARAGVTCSP